MANNPRYHGGATDVAGGSKVMRPVAVVRRGSTLPIVSLCDEPGFMVGLEAEKQGIERAGAQLLVVTSQSRMPWITVVTGRVFGVAGSTHHRASGMFRRYAWPSATWGVHADRRRRLRRLSSGDRQRAGPGSEAAGNRGAPCTR